MKEIKNMKKKEINQKQIIDKKDRDLGNFKKAFKIF